MDSRARIIRKFLAVTVCWNYKDSDCRMHYGGITELCPPLELDIKQFIEKTAMKFGSKPPRICMTKD